MEIHEIYGLLRRLGVNATYRGFRPTADAVLLCTQRPESLVLVTKILYPEIAKKYGTTWMSVERNIRTLSGVVWKKEPALLAFLAGTALERRPSASEFIDILAAALTEGRASQL